ncbi:protease modulator HflC [Candidatus Omnitrophota bacterium]
MKGISRIFVGLLVIVVFVFISGFAFIVDETKQVVITQFGKPVGDPIVTAGLHFKLPFIQQAHYFEKRLLDWDGDPNQVPTRDKKYIWVDVTARWKIADTLKFLQSVGSEVGAQGRLDDVLNSATRDIITGHLLVESARNSNRILEATEKEGIVVTKEALERIEVGRQMLEHAIFEKASKDVPAYGIELVDVRIKRINYVDTVARKVYERMVAERKRAAEQYRSEGQGKRAEIDGQREKELRQIASEAYRKSEILKGKADAETIKIYADAYNNDPEFYSFFKTLDTYRETIDENSTLILTTDSEYYRYLQGLDSIPR